MCSGKPGTLMNRDVRGCGAGFLKTVQYKLIAKRRKSVMQNGKVVLTFVENDCTLQFENEAEFFETLGLLSREEGQVWIEGEPSYKFLEFDADGKLLKNPEKEVRRVNFKVKDGRMLFSDLDSFRIVNMNRGYLVKPLLELFKNSKERDFIKCPVFVNYLIEEFGFGYKLDKNHTKVEIKQPDFHEMKEILKQKNLEHFVNSFAKGLYEQRNGN